MTAGRTVVGKSQDWCTPRRYVEAVKLCFGGRIDLDPCSNRHSIVGARVEYRLPKTDGLAASWEFKHIYVNPPYGADRERGTRIGDWLRRCSEANAEHGSEVLALVPVATNTGHWKRFVWGVATGIAFLYDTRLRFLENGEDKGKGAPMSCAMVYWGNRFTRFERVFSRWGAVVDITRLQEQAALKGKREAKQLALPWR